MRVRFAAKTDVGRKRNHNEDYFAVDEDERLFIVADGMGGHASGEVASKLAVETISEFFKRTSLDDDTTWPFKLDRSLSYAENRLVCSLQDANRRVFQAAEKTAEHRGMGTTIVALVASHDEVTIAHAGDSRAYRIRDGKIQQLTRDHSLLRNYKDTHPNCSQADEDKFPGKHVITRALGMGASLEPSLVSERAEEGDMYLLCSDGLSNMLRDAEILRFVSKASSLERAVWQLVHNANRTGGTDNITAILIRIALDN